MASNHDDTFDLILEPRKLSSQYWRDLWQYRELFFFLAWRDILVRYKQTVIGIAWSVLRPLLTMLVFTVVFGRLAKLPAAGAPYPVLVFTAMLPWQLFADALNEASNSLINNANLLTKIYFPRLIMPVSTIMVTLIDFCIALALLFALMAWYGVWPSWRIVTLPLFLLLAVLTALGSGLWLAALNVKYRDFRYVIPFLLQLGLYISPVGFSSTIVPDQWRLLYSLNPMVGVIDGFRWALLDAGAHLYLPGFALSVSIVGLLLASGLAFFRRTERAFADII